MGSEGAPRPRVLKKVKTWDEPEYKVVECTSLEEATYEGSDSDVGNMEAGGAGIWTWMIC